MIRALVKIGIAIAIAIWFKQDGVLGVEVVAALWLATLLARAGYLLYARSHTTDNNYTPAALANVRTSPALIRGTFGTPGASLDSSGFDHNSIEAGQAGEYQLFRALVKEGILNRYDTISAWSCPIPAMGGAFADPNYSSDIDAIIVRGHTIYVVDAKRWAGGPNVTYKHKNGQVWRYRDGHPEQPMSLSHNMEMAVDRVKNMVKGTGYKVRGFVCVMPTEKGAPHITPFTYAPGRIPVISARSLVMRLKARPGLLPVSVRVRSRLKSLAYSRQHPTYR